MISYRYILLPLCDVMYLLIKILNLIDSVGCDLRVNASSIIIELSGC